MQAKTCGESLCRGRRERRMAKEKKRRSEAMTDLMTDPPHLAAMRDEELLREVARQELVPVVREAITEDVLRAAQKLVSLTPLMVDLIQADMLGTDKQLRQKAYSLLARYTLGNQSIAPTPEVAANAPMTVVFELPRPGSQLDTPPTSAAEPVELRECNECHVHKPLAEFVASSDRCQACHDTVADKVRERFGQL